MTSVHMRLLGCLEQYQTAKQAHEFMVEYFGVLKRQSQIIDFDNILEE